MSLLALPEELLTNVLAVLPNAVYESTCQSVCRRWRDLKSSSAFRAARREVDERVLVVTGWEDGNSYTVLENFALINGQWRKMAMSEVCVHGGAAVQKPLMASLPLDVFAENVAPSSAAADDASEPSYDGPCAEPDSDDLSDDSSEEGDSTDSDGDDEDDEDDGAAL